MTETRSSSQVGIISMTAVQQLTWKEASLLFNALNSPLRQCDCDFSSPFFKETYATWSWQCFCVWFYPLSDWRLELTLVCCRYKRSRTSFHPQLLSHRAFIWPWSIFTLVGWRLCLYLVMVRSQEFVIFPHSCTLQWWTLFSTAPFQRCSCCFFMASVSRYHLITFKT